MKHPTEEQWMDFLYVELPADQARELKSHLEMCPECQHRTAEWTSTLKMLDSWKLDPPTKIKPRASRGGGWKWAAAACVLITSAFAAGRLSNPPVDVAAIRAEIAEPLQKAVEEDLRRELGNKVSIAASEAVAEVHRKISEQLATEIDEVTRKASENALLAIEKQVQQLSATFASLREEDKQQFISTLKDIEAQRVADLRLLRKELETVAVNTDQSLRHAQRQLVQLASSNQSSQ